MRSIEEARVAIKSPLCPLAPPLMSVATLCDDGDDEHADVSDDDGDKDDENDDVRGDGNGAL